MMRCIFVTFLSDGMSLGWCCVNVAVAKGNTEVALKLMKAGADINPKNVVCAR